MAKLAVVPIMRSYPETIARHLKLRRKYQELFEIRVNGLSKIDEFVEFIKNTMDPIIARGIIAGVRYLIWRLLRDLRENIKSLSNEIEEALHSQSIDNVVRVLGRLERTFSKNAVIQGLLSMRPLELRITFLRNNENTMVLMRLIEDPIAVSVIVGNNVAQTREYIMELDKNGDVREDWLRREFIDWYRILR